MHCRTLLLTLVTLTTSAALAHAELQGSTPGDGERLSTAPTEIELVFSEAIQLDFSTFKVYPLPDDLAAATEDEEMAADMTPMDDHSEEEGGDDDHGDAATDDGTDDTNDDSAEASDDHGDDAGDDQAAADGVAAAFVEEMLPVEGDEAERVDEDATAQGSEVTLSLKGNLEPGWYVAMWSALSSDGHPVEGFVTFAYQP